MHKYLKPSKDFDKEQIKLSNKNKSSLSKKNKIFLSRYKILSKKNLKPKFP